MLKFVSAIPVHSLEVLQLSIVTHLLFQVCHTQTHTPTHTHSPSLSLSLSLSASLQLSLILLRGWQWLWWRKRAGLSSECHGNHRIRLTPAPVGSPSSMRSVSSWSRKRNGRCGTCYSCKVGLCRTARKYSPIHFLISGRLYITILLLKGSS